MDLLLAQKCYAILNRVRNEGRDFYDMLFLLGRGALPNYDCLAKKVGVNDAMFLRSRLPDHCASLNMGEMAADVRPFLFQPGEARRVLLFADYLQQVPL